MKHGGSVLRVILLTCAVLFISRTARAYPEYLLNQPYSIRFFQLDSLGHALARLDSTKSDGQIDDLVKWADNADDDELRYGLEVMRFNVLLMQNRFYGSLFENGMEELIGKLHKFKMVNLQAEALVLYARYCWMSPGKYARAFEYTLDAYNLYSKIPVKDFPPKSEYIMGVGGAYFRFGDYRTALRYMLEGVNTQPHYSNGATLHSMLNTVALCYRHLEVLDSAEYYFRLAYADVKDTAHDIWAGIISGNLGITYYKDKKYRESIPYLEKDIRMSLGHDDMNAANSIAALGDVYVLLGEKQKGLATILQAYDIVIKDNGWKEYHVLEGLYPRMAKAYAANGNYMLAYNFYDSATRVKDSATKILNGVTLANAQHTFELERHKTELEKKEKEERLNVFLRNTFLAGIAVVWIIAFLVINRQRLASKFRHEQLQAEKQKAESSLKNANEMLNTFTRNMYEKNELIERFNAEIEQLRQLPGASKMYRDKPTIIELQSSAILSGEQWDHFSSLFEKANPGYMKRLKQKVPELSPVEARFIVLSKLKLRTKEIVGILGISEESVLLNKQKLRTKLNLGDDPNSLEKFSNTI